MELFFSLYVSEWFIQYQLVNEVLFVYDRLLVECVALREKLAIGFENDVRSLNLFCGCHRFVHGKRSSQRMHVLTCVNVTREGSCQAQFMCQQHLAPRAETQHQPLLLSFMIYPSLKQECV